MDVLGMFPSESLLVNVPVTVEEMDDEEKTICCKRKGCETSLGKSIRMHLPVMVDSQVMQYRILCAVVLPRLRLAAG